MFLAWKEMRRNKTRFLMIGIMFVLISWLVFILAGLGNGLTTLAASTFKNMAADYVVFEKGSQASMGKSLLSGELTDELLKIPGVEAASPMGIIMGSAVRKIDDSHEAKLDIAIIGIEPGSFLEPPVAEGTGLDAGRPTYAIVNETMKDEGYERGDTFALDGTSVSLTIAGFVRNQTYNHVTAVFIPIDHWRELAFAAPGSDKGIRNPVNAIMLQGKAIDPETVNERLPGTETVTRAQAVQGIAGYKEESGTIMMMLGFLFVISAFIIGVFFYVITLQKSNQFGIMKAIGARNGFLGKAVISQVFILSLLSIVTGVLLTYGTAAVLPEGMPFILDTTWMIAYSLILLAIALLSALATVRTIVKVDPLQALGRVE
ncbi:MAG: cell division protein FtsX [Thermobacillus sp. ZCTH02-B1]|uniref:ABC transporter permease n=1 Tax=Thermobacillus sp. ZCTH02-B1 TaxID=1858795 RepID=UPI000B562005|nr:ABC transporter permease [Thermobacillus sp. ZCTH02-B1]OUM95813.1 MAG: cell division protein FtsX [Thermobacillus sp. ZCTH02-B1]